jgi:hypothetical protein
MFSKRCGAYLLSANDLNVNHICTLLILFRNPLQQIIKSFCFIKMFLFRTCRKSNKTFRMYFNNIFVSFIVFLFSHIKILINVNPFYYFFALVMDHQNNIIKYYNIDWFLFVLMDLKHLKLL